MNRTPVVSKTGMCGIAYDAASSTLEIAFVNKKGQPERVYHYTPFTAEDWEAFQAAESKGSHFLKHIKPAFRCTRIEEKTDAEGEQKDQPKKFKTATDDETIPF